MKAVRRQFIFVIYLLSPLSLTLFVLKQTGHALSSLYGLCSSWSAENASGASRARSGMAAQSGGSVENSAAILLRIEARVRGKHQN